MTQWRQRMSASTYWTTPVMRRLRRKTILTRRRRQMALVMQRKELGAAMVAGSWKEREPLASLKEAKELLTILASCLLTMMKWLSSAKRVARKRRGSPDRRAQIRSRRRGRNQKSRRHMRMRVLPLMGLLTEVSRRISLQNPPPRFPPRPDPAQPEDSPAVKASRETLLREWNEVVATQQLYRELVRGLNKKQAEYTEVIHQGPDASSSNLSRGMMQQKHNQRINEATVAIQQVMTKVNAARAASGVSLAKHQRAREDLDRALAAMARSSKLPPSFGKVRLARTTSRRR